MTINPSFLCLAGIFNHRQEWTENLVEMFLRQEYEGQALLLLLDDRSISKQMPTFAASRGNNRVYSMHHSTRFPTLMEKYDWGLSLGVSLGMNGYCCVMDDDDLYLPGFLAAHAAVLGKGKPWSRPEEVWSTYGQKLQRVPVRGGFWAASAYTLAALQQAGGYGASPSASFDQHFISKMEKEHGIPGIPEGVPQYIYNWEMSCDSHASGHMTGPEDTAWYRGTSESRSKEPLVPALNQTAVEILQSPWLWNQE